jgi:hypothetical protein
VAALHAEHVAQLAKLDRVSAAAARLATLSHSMCFISVAQLREAGRLQRRPCPAARLTGLLLTGLRLTGLLAR